MRSGPGQMCLCRVTVASETQPGAMKREFSLHLRETLPPLEAANKRKLAGGSWFGFGLSRMLCLPAPEAEGSGSGSCPPALPSVLPAET